MLVLCMYVLSTVGPAVWIFVSTERKPAVAAVINGSIGQPSGNDSKILETDVGEVFICVYGV